MPEAKKILVAVERDEKTVAPVIQWAALMARAIEGRLTLLHVNESVEGLQGRGALSDAEGVERETIERWRTQYETSARTELSNLIAQYCAGVTTNMLVLAGRAPAVILGAIESTNCGLVVMGTHGRPWYERALIGSTAEAILRTSPIPVLIVHNTIATPPPTRLARLLYPTDCSSASERGEEWTRALVRHGVREVVLVHSVENPLLDLYNPDSVDIDVRRLMEEARQHPPRSAQPFWDHAHQVAHAKLSEFRQRLLPALADAGQVEVVVGEGPAVESILRVTEQKHPDLIIMTTHGRTGVQRLLLGSVTTKIVRAVSCPVLVVPSQES